MWRNPNSSCIVGQQQSVHTWLVAMSPWIWAHVRKGHGAPAQVCGWMGTSLGKPKQTVKWDSWWPVSCLFCQSFWNNAVIHQGEKTMWVMSPGGCEEMCPFLQRGQGWPEFLEILMEPSWNYLVCLFCSRGGRVGVLVSRGISRVLTWARGTVSWENHISNDRMTPFSYNL